MKCPKCGFENHSKRHLCSKKLSESKSGHKQTDRRISYIVGAIVSLAFLGGLFLYISSLQLSNPKIIEKSSNDPLVEVKVLAIAQNFICKCGSCGEETLDQCTCEHAIKIKQIIRDRIQNRKTNEEIIAAINNDFGGLKNEHSKQDHASSLPQSTKFASSIDRLEIYSHFRCPCGKCGMDELNACNCDHPRGAKEVKAFVDEKLVEGKFTAIQIVDEIERKYGARKF